MLLIVPCARVVSTNITKAHYMTLAEPWLEACVYACARLLSMAMHAYARLHPNTLHAWVRLGSGTQRWTSCIVMHRFSAGKKNGAGGIFV